MHKRILAVCAFAIVCVLVMLGEAAAFAQQDSTIELLQTQRAWNDANLHHDGATLRKILDPGFVEIAESGDVVPLDAALHRLLSTPPSGRQYKIYDQNLLRHGSIATISALYTEVGIGNQGPYRVTLRIADVYRYDGHWRGLVGYVHLIRLVHCKGPCSL